MKFGLARSVQHSPDDSQAGRFQEHLEQVRLASAVCFDSVWASQHYLSALFTTSSRFLSSRASRPNPACGSFASDFEARARDRFLLGDPARVREEIARYHDTLDVTAIIVRVQ